jgi:outer membrane protein assembly factor BamB
MPWMRSLLVLCGVVAAAPAGDWPQWLGPNRDASTSEKVEPWPQAPKVLWRKPVGEGHSSPVVAGGRVFLHTRAADKQEEVINAWDARTGEDLWQAGYSRAAFSSIFGNGPRATPAVAGDRVYTFGVTGILSAYEAASGKRAWQLDTLKEFNAKNLFFGTSCSPLVDGDRLFLNVGGPGASLVAFATGDGKVLWKNLDDPASYSSPILFKTGSQRQLVFLTQQGLNSVNPADGALWWKFPLKDLLSESSTTPVRAGDRLLASSVTYGTVGLRMQDKDGKPEAEKVWKNTDLTCYFSTPVAVGKEHVYMVTGKVALGRRPEATLRCVETATGKELWQKAHVGEYHASLLRAGDDRLLMLDDAGSLMVLDPNPKAYRELCRAKVCGKTWAHPALADGRLYLRDDKELLCLQLK